jgi:hypothetical protein
LVDPTTTRDRLEMLSTMIDGALTIDSCDSDDENEREMYAFGASRRPRDRDDSEIRRVPCLPLPWHMRKLLRQC